MERKVTVTEELNAIVTALGEISLSAGMMETLNIQAVNELMNKFMVPLVQNINRMKRLAAAIEQAEAQATEKLEEEQKETDGPELELVADGEVVGEPAENET